jgi:FixJ family two-component response regulator
MATADFRYAPLATESKSRLTTGNWSQRSIARLPGASNTWIRKERKARSRLDLPGCRRTTTRFDLVADGFTSHAIAAKLHISVRTVDSYRAEVMEKMQAESVAGLVR